MVPDLATIRVGASQAFSVFNVTVVQFSLRADEGTWSECVHVGEASPADGRIRLFADAPCPGLLYLTADLGPQRSPLVALVRVE